MALQIQDIKPEIQDTMARDIELADTSTVTKAQGSNPLIT